MQAVSHGDPAGRFISDPGWFNYYVLVLSFKGLFQFIFKLVLGIFTVVDLMYDVPLARGKGRPDKKKNL